MQLQYTTALWELNLNKKVSPFIKASLFHTFKHNLIQISNDTNTNTYSLPKYTILVLLKKIKKYLYLIKYTIHS